VIERIDLVAYKLQLPPTTRIRPIFHLSLLNKYYGDHPQSHVPMLLLTTAKGSVIQPQHILASYVILRDTKQVLQLLIQWESLDASHSTWENLNIIIRDYPNFNLEDKVAFDGEGNVMG